MWHVTEDRWIAVDGNAITTKHKIWQVVNRGFGPPERKRDVSHDQCSKTRCPLFRLLSKMSYV